MDALHEAESVLGYL